MATAVFSSIKNALEKDPDKAEDIVSSFKGKAMFIIKSKNGDENKYFFLNLKEGKGDVELDAAAKVDGSDVDLTLTMGEETLVKLVAGKLSAQMAFMTGKLKLKGNIGLAMKLQTVFDMIQPAPKL